VRLVDRADVPWHRLAAELVDARQRIRVRNYGADLALALDELEGLAEKPALAVRFDLVEQHEAAEVDAGGRLEAGVFRHGVIIHRHREDGDADELARVRSSRAEEAGAKARGRVARAVVMLDDEALSDELVDLGDLVQLRPEELAGRPPGRAARFQRWQGSRAHLLDLDDTIGRAEGRHVELPELESGRGELLELEAADRAGRKVLGDLVGLLHLHSWAPVPEARCSVVLRKAAYTH
jgi:hypothetical protein